MRSTKKHELDAVVAAELGLSVKEVRAITRAFLEQIKESLASLEEVQLAEFGRFRTVLEKAPTKGVELVQVTNGGRKRRKKRITSFRKVRVHFSKSESFKRMMQARHGPLPEKKT